MTEGNHTMKLTKTHLRRIIKEEIEVTLEGFLDRFKKKSPAPPAEPSAPAYTDAELESTPAEHLVYFFDKPPIGIDSRDTRILQLTVQSFQEKGGDVNDKQAFIDFVAKGNPDKAAMMQKMLK